MAPRPADRSTPQSGATTASTPTTACSSATSAATATFVSTAIWSARARGRNHEAIRIRFEAQLRAQIDAQLLDQRAKVCHASANEFVRRPGAELDQGPVTKENYVGERFFQLAPVARLGGCEGTGECAVGRRQRFEPLGVLAVLALPLVLHPLHDRDANDEQDYRHAQRYHERDRERSHVDQLHFTSSISPSDKGAPRWQ